MNDGVLLMADERLGAAILAAYFLVVLIAAEAWARLGSPRPELPRKLVHMAGGLGCLFFPLLVRSPWIVLAMSGSLSILFAAAQRWGFLPGLHGVGRSSRGAEYYPLAIFAVFLLADGRLWVYFASVLTLAVADGFAALVGGRYGTISYRIEEGRKSVEGSLVFLVLAFLAIHLPLLLLTSVPRPVCVLAALHVAVIVTGLEAIALRGTDNLWVPIGVAYILLKITAQPLEEVIYQNVSLLLLTVAIATASARVPMFHAGASLVFVLYAYGCWALGGWPWALPLLSGFAAFLLSWYALRPEGGAQGRIGVRTTERAVIPVFAVLLVANTLHVHRELYGPFLAANATLLALALARRIGRRTGDGPAKATALAGGGLLAVAAVAGPPFLVQTGVSPAAPLSLAALIVPATWIGAALDRGRSDPVPRWPWARVVLCLAAAAGLFAGQIAGIIPPWNPLQRW